MDTRVRFSCAPPPCMRLAPAPDRGALADPRSDRLRPLRVGCGVAIAGRLFNAARHWHWHCHRRQRNIPVRRVRGSSMITSRNLNLTMTLTSGVKVRMLSTVSTIVYRIRIHALFAEQGLARPLIIDISHCQPLPVIYR